MSELSLSKERFLELTVAHAQKLKGLQASGGLTKSDSKFGNQLLVWVDTDHNLDQTPEVLQPVNWWKRSSTKSVNGAHTNSQWRKHLLEIAIMDEIYPAENWQTRFLGNPDADILNCRHPFGTHIDVHPTQVRATLLKRLMTPEETRAVSEYTAFQLSHPRPKFFPYYNSSENIGWFPSQNPGEIITDPSHRWNLGIRLPPGAMGGDRIG